MVEIENLVVENNIGLVFSRVFKLRKARKTVVDIEDLIHEGTLGFIRSLATFTFTKNCALSTYATQWIDHFLFRAVDNQDTTIRIPSNIRAAASRVARGTPLSKHDKETPTIQHGLDMLFLNGRGLASLDDVVAPSVSTRLVDTLESNDRFSVEGYLDQKYAAGVLRHVMRSTLSAKEDYVVSRRYGIGCKALELDDLGAEFGVSRQRILQIEKKAISKMGSVRHKFEERGVSLCQ